MGGVLFTIGYEGTAMPEFLRSNSEARSTKTRLLQDGFMKHANRLMIGATVFACAALTALPTVGPAQVAYDSPRGRVEVLGLRRWTLAMLRDSIRHYVPGQELHDAACMVTLRDSLHFADASVGWMMDWPVGGKATQTYLTIKLVEPEDAARVQWDTRPRDAYTSLLSVYAPLIMPVTDSTGSVLSGRIDHWLQFSDSTGRQRAVAEAPASARSDAERLVGFLGSMRAERDRRRAMAVLKRDGFWVNRMVAAVVLSNFAVHDSTWWSLARALRDPNEGVRSTASIVMRSLPARPVDWSGASQDLRLLVGGTNLPAMRDVFMVLANTKISPDMAPVILRDNADWVLDHLAAETPMASDAAHRLLLRLNRGRDLGRSREAWQAWVGTL